MDRSVAAIVAWGVPYAALLVVAAVLLAHGYQTHQHASVPRASSQVASMLKQADGLASSTAVRPTVHAGAAAPAASQGRSRAVTLGDTLTTTPLFLLPLFLSGLPFVFSIWSLSRGRHAEAAILSLLSLMALVGWYVFLGFSWAQINEQGAASASSPGHAEVSIAVMLYAIDAAIALVLFPRGARLARSA